MIEKLIPLSDEERMARDAYIKKYTRGLYILPLTLLLCIIFYPLILKSEFPDRARVYVFFMVGFGVLVYLPIVYAIYCSWKKRGNDTHKIAYDAVVKIDNPFFDRLMSRQCPYITVQRAGNDINLGIDFFIDHKKYNAIRKAAKNGDAVRVTVTEPSGLVLAIEKIASADQDKGVYPQ